MQKRQLLIPLSLLPAVAVVVAVLSQPAAAQSQPDDAILHSHLVQSMLQRQQCAATSAALQKTATSSERLIAQSTYAPDAGVYFMTDTIQYNYGSVPLGSWFNYNTLTWALYGGQNAVINNMPIAGGPAIFTQPLINPYVSSDSSLELYRYLSGSAMQRQGAVYNTFGPAGELTAQRYYNSNTAKNGQATRYFYAASSGRLDSTYTLYILNNSIAATPSEKRFYFYNGAGQLTMDSNVTQPQTTYHPYLKHEYNYAAGGLLNSVVTYRQDWNSTAWMLKRRDSMSYNSSNQLTFLVSDTGTLMKPYKKTVLTYFGSSSAYPFYQSLTEYTRNNFAPVWDTTSATVMTLNSTNLPATADRRTYSPNGGGLFGGQKSSIIYTTGRNPLLISDSLYDNTSGQAGAYVTRFYYGNYSTLNVAATAGMVDIEVFPNPAHSTVKLRFSVMTSGAYEAAIYDLKGRLVQPVPAGNYAAGTKAFIACDVAALPPGMYVLRLHGAGSISWSRSFIRQ